MKWIDELQKLRVIPVVRLKDADTAVPMAAALRRGGLPCAEITFCTPAAAESLRRIHEADPEFLLAAGTVLTTAQADAAMAAGAAFLVSPGFNAKVAVHCIDHGYPLVPGICTPRLKRPCRLVLCGLNSSQLRRPEVWQCCARCTRPTVWYALCRPEASRPQIWQTIWPVRLYLPSSAMRRDWSAVLADRCSGSCCVSRCYEFDAVDRIGGGDAFSGALIHALLNRLPMQQAIDFAAAAGCLKYTIEGDVNAVTSDEVMTLAGITE